MSEQNDHKGPTSGASSAKEPHDEWLIDESIEETFPASDSTLPSRPGSTLSERYVSSRTDRRGVQTEKLHGSLGTPNTIVERRRLGNSHLEITPLGLGSWAIGGPRGQFSRGPQDDSESVRTIHRALDLGVNWIDTAPAYGMGHAEEIIAKALRDRHGTRPYVFTKCGVRWNERGEMHRVLKKASIREECEASLARVGIDAIDPYLIHRPVDEAAENTDAWETLAALQKEGKVRWIGLSNSSMEQMRAAQAIAPIACVEPPYSLVKRDIEHDLLPYCAEQRIGVLVYSPLASGLLSGRMTRERALGLPANDVRRRSADFQDPRLAKILALADKLQEIGSRYGHSAANIAVAWSLRLSSVTGAIVGARTPMQMEEAVGAMSVRLEEDDLMVLQQLADSL